VKPVQWDYHGSADVTALRGVFDAWQAARPGVGILALASEHEPHGVAALQEAASAAGVPLVGAGVPGLIAESRLRQAGVLLLALDPAVPRAIVPLADADDGDAARRLADFVEAHAGCDGDDTLLLLLDATIDVSSLLDRLYLIVGNQVRYAGASVGSERFTAIPCVFDASGLYGDVALAVLLPRHPGATPAHHYAGVSPLSVATGARGNQVTSIDGLPAFGAYQALVAQAYGATVTADNAAEHFVRFPLALHLAEGEPLVRFPRTVGDDSSLTCVGEVPEVALLSIVEAPPPASARAVLAFACAGRLMRPDAAADVEFAELQAALASAPVFGALSLGEIANHESQGYPRFHTATLCAMPWS
jgi:hypothetical protein